MTMIAIPVYQHTLSRTDIDPEALVILHRDEAVATMSREHLPYTLEGVTLCRKSDDGDCLVRKSVADSDVRIALLSSGRIDPHGKAWLVCHVEHEIGPVTEISQDSAALLRMEVPVLGIDLVTRDKPAVHPCPSLSAQRFENELTEITTRPVESQNHFSGRAPHRVDQPSELVVGNDVGFFDVHVFPVLQRIDSVFSVRGVVG